MANFRIKGVDKVMNSLNREIARMKAATLEGLIRAQILLRRDMESTPPLIPVDTGNLRASWFAVTGDGQVIAGQGGGFIGTQSSIMADEHQEILAKYLAVAMGKNYPNMVMGFSANYASYVHEMVGAHFQRPDAGAKFFEAALLRNKEAILQIIADSAKVKK